MLERAMLVAPVGSPSQVINVFSTMLEFVEGVNFEPNLELHGQKKVDVALKLTEIYVNAKTSVSADKGDALAHGLALGLKDLVDSLENKNER